MKLDSIATYQTTPLPIGGEAIPPSSPVQIAGGGEFVLGLFGKSERPNAFMIVNRNYRRDTEAVVKVLIPGRKLQELDRKTGKWSKFVTFEQDRMVKVKLGPGDGRLFSVEK